MIFWLKLICRDVDHESSAAQKIGREIRYGEKVGAEECPLGGEEHSRNRSLVRKTPGAEFPCRSGCSAADGSGVWPAAARLRPQAADRRRSIRGSGGAGQRNWRKRQERRQHLMDRRRSAAWGRRRAAAGHTPEPS